MEPVNTTGPRACCVFLMAVTGLGLGLLLMVWVCSSWTKGLGLLLMAVRFAPDGSQTQGFRFAPDGSQGFGLDGSQGPGQQST